MGALQEKRDVVFGINRTHHYPDVPTPTVDMGASTAFEFSQPWQNIFSGHPSNVGTSLTLPGGHGSGIIVWVNTNVPGGYLSKHVGVVNAFGIVNMSYRIKDDGVVPGRINQIGCDIRTASTATGSTNNVFAFTASQSTHLDIASAASKSFLLEHSEEDTAAYTPAQYYRFNFRSQLNTQNIEWFRLGELFIGNIYHPPCPHSIRDKPSRAATLFRNADNTWAWNRRARRSGRRITLGWRGISDAEKLELYQFVANVGDPYHHAHRPDATDIGVGPVAGLNDFASPVMLSLHREAYNTTTPTWRSAIYCVVDPASVDFAYNSAANTWDARASFIEVA